MAVKDGDTDSKASASWTVIRIVPTPTLASRRLSGSMPLILLLFLRVAILHASKARAYLRLRAVLIKSQLSRFTPFVCLLPERSVTAAWPKFFHRNMFVSWNEHTPHWILQYTAIIIIIEVYAACMHPQQQRL
jgi:hypothetical protein